MDPGALHDMLSSVAAEAEPGLAELKDLIRSGRRLVKKLRSSEQRLSYWIKRPRRKLKDYKKMLSMWTLEVIPSDASLERFTSLTRDKFESRLRLYTKAAKDFEADHPMLKRLGIS
jgi:hypothetical protein